MIIHLFFRLTVRKDGPNKGRQFYACPQGPSSPCTFFQWADADSTSTNHGNQWSSSSRGRGRGRGDSAPRGTTGAKRKCGICSIEGITIIIIVIIDNIINFFYICSGFFYKIIIYI